MRWFFILYIQQDELAFWGLTINDLDPCCKRNLNKFNKLQRDLESFEKSMKDDHDTFSSRGCCQLTGSRLTKGRRCLWSLLDQPFSSIPARVSVFIKRLTCHDQIYPQKTTQTKFCSLLYMLGQQMASINITAAIITILAIVRSYLQRVNQLNGSVVKGVVIRRSDLCPLV